MVKVGTNSMEDELVVQSGEFLPSMHLVLLAHAPEQIIPVMKPVLKNVTTKKYGSVTIAAVVL